MATRVRSYSKINLGLAIGPARADGFHALTTLYQTLAAHDLVTVAAELLAPGAESRLLLTTNDRRVPTDGRNTAWKMVERALGELGVRAEVSIHIDKRLPVQGGLGAGSANAAAALIGLERELGLRLEGGARLRIAAEVGSDVPLFLLGGAVLGLGRGEEVYPMPELPACSCVVALPSVGVSTPAAFREWDTQQMQLTAEAASDRLKRLSQAIAAGLCEPHSSGVFSASGEGLAGNPLSALVRTGTNAELRNDFEEVVFRQHPALFQIKRTLEGSGCEYAALSGSGSALFGLYRTDDAASEAVRRLEQLGVASLRTVTLPRSEYWSGMVEQVGSCYSSRQ